MNANMQQWAGELRANAETIAAVILTSDSAPSDLRTLNSLLISVYHTAQAMKSKVEIGETK
jgi:hypothetical protein